MDLLGEEGGEDGLRINAKYAERFEREARRRELHKSVSLGLLEESEEESSEEDEDEDGAALSERLDAQIIHTINAIRKKDPKIYDKETVWFEQEGDEGSDSDSEESKADDEAGSQKKRFKDVVREQLLEEMDEEEARGSKRSQQRVKAQLEYDDEQSNLRESILKSIDNAQSDDAEDAEDILKPLVKDYKEKAEREEKLQRELEEMKRLGKCGLEDPSQDDFLFDYLAKQKWKDKSLSFETNAFDENADEEAIDDMDRYESSYNFRFEEVESDLAGQVVGHARQVNESVRRKDTKRKEQREKRLERKERERKAKEAELRRLKNLKRLEVISSVCVSTLPLYSLRNV